MAYDAAHALLTPLRRSSRSGRRPQRALASVRKYAPWIAVGWVLVPVALLFFIVAAPPTPAVQPPLLPPSTAATAALAQPADTEAEPTVLGQLVVTADHALGPADRSYYDALMKRLGTDTAHVESVVPTWSDPLTADIATSGDHRGAYGLVWLKGAPGSAAARDSAAAIDAAIAAVPTPSGVRAHLGGPATAFQMPSSPSWSTAIAVLATVLILIAIAVQRVCRPNVRLTVLAGTAAAAMFAATPVVYLLAAARMLTLSPLSVALGGVLTTCAAIDFTLVITRGYHRLRRSGADHDRALADAYGSLLRHVLIAAPALTAMFSASLFLHTPLLREVTVPSAIGVAIALLAVVMLVPGLIGRSAESPAWSRSWAAGKLMPPNRGRLFITVVTAGALLIGATAVSAHNTRPTTPDEGGPFALSQLLPDVVTIDSDRDLRTPSGLASINGVTRKLLALPGVTRVQSASAPAGMPWNQATFAYQAGQLGGQAQQLATSAAAQVGPVKSLAATLDALSATIDRARRGGQAGDFSHAAATVGAGIQSLQRTAAVVTSAVAPIQEWMQGIPNCTNNTACADAQRLLAPFGDVLRSVGAVGRDANGLFNAPRSSAPATDLLGQLQSVINQLRALVPGLSRAITTVLPQISSLATSMKHIGQSFGGNLQGSFYLPSSVINGVSYRPVRESMFSPDGHRTRLLVYGALDNPNLPLWQRPAAIAGVLGVAAKDGVLSDQTVTVSGTGIAALLLRDLARHDATALTLCFLLATLLAAGIMMRHRRAMALLSALAAAFLATGTAVWIATTDIVVGEITWLAVLLAMAVAGPMMVHHHICMAGGARSRQPFRQPANVMCLAGIAFGVAVWMAPGDSLLHRSAVLMAIALSATAATNTLSRAHLAALPAALRALWTPPRPQAIPRMASVRPVAAAPCAPISVRPRVAPASAVSRSASRRAKALMRQEHVIYLEGPVPSGQRPGFAT